MTGTFEFRVVPVPKPRQTRSDKWKQRPCVVAYREFADALRSAAAAERFTMPEAGAVVVFRLPMPKSWSEAKRNRMHGQPHRQKPDVDNLLKAFLDALCDDDCAIWNVAAQKRWSDDPRISVTLTPVGP